MQTFRDFDEIKAAVGVEVGVSDRVDGTQQRIDQFAQATEDDQWVHVDFARAERELPGSTTIAHGLLTLSFTPVFVRSVVLKEGARNTLNYGANRIRYPAPILAGSRLRGRIAIAASEDALRNGLRSSMVLQSRSRTTSVWPAGPISIAVHYR